MAIVWPCELSVEAYAEAAKAVAVPRQDCPGCQRAMTFWSGYWRYVRNGADARIWVRRARCPCCRVSHALVPSFCLARRLDAVAVVGEVMLGAFGGKPLRIPAGVGSSTVRSWLSRHRLKAPGLLRATLAVAPASLDHEPWPREPSSEAEVLLAVRAVAGALWVGLAPWAALSAFTGGTWLSPTTTDVAPIWRFCSPQGAVMVPMATPQPTRRPP